ncbi:Putative odorant receptor 13a [Atta colombica]|uniref:Putative odorant receptor 13a n=1 Tax=Atta colombica TaxID=520822 RepID=A0A195BRE2_9HYME|nr:Putative odorant receptor 13a [Atta colombica]
MDPKIAKDLLFLLIRGTKPVYLTAGKVFPMTMATFCDLMKTSAGYISVLHTTKDNLQFTLPAISCSIRIAIFWWKKEAITPIIDMIAEDWIKSKNEQERNIMIRKAHIARMIVACAYCIMAVGCLFIIIPPGFGIPIRLTTNITDPGRIVPLQTHYIYDVTKQPQYELTYISQTIYIVLAVLSYTGIDHFLGLLVFHISGQLNILKNRNDLSFTHLIFFMSTFLNLFVHTCLYCALGEFLVAQCNEIYYAAYSNEWYSVNPKIAQDLLFLLIRGAKPIHLTAGKIFPMTMMTFCRDLLLLMTRGSKQICLTVGKMSPVTMATFCSVRYIFNYIYYIKILFNVDFEWAVKLNRFSLNLIGLWPKTAQNFRQQLMSNFRVLVVFLSITLGLLIPSIHSLTRIFGDIILMLDNLQFTLPAISCSIRIIIFWWKKEAIEPIMNMIVEDWVKLKNTEERSIMIRRAQSARIIITFAYCIMGIGCFFLIVLPSFGISMRDTTNITDPGRPMPLQTYYIYDVTKSPQYELTFISQSIYIIIAMMSYSGIDNFLGLLVFHICGQLDILKNRLTNLDKCKNSHKILNNCITRHRRLLRVIDIIEDTYNVILLFLFVYFAILFAFYGFRIITVSIF